MTKIALNLSKRVLERFLEKTNQGANPLLPEGGDFNYTTDKQAEEEENLYDFNTLYNNNDFMETLDNYLYRVANKQEVYTKALWKEFERVLEKSLPHKAVFRSMTSSEKESYDNFLAEAINEVFGESKAKNQFSDDLKNYLNK